VLREVFGLWGGGGVAGELRKSPGEDLHGVYPSPSVGRRDGRGLWRVWERREIFAET
jgi:hypothetical protein